MSSRIAAPAPNVRCWPRAASPYAALALGLLLLYLIFAVPFWIGFLARLVATWLGLGTILLALRERFAARTSAA